jgi:hypothetical protein
MVSLLITWGIIVFVVFIMSIGVIFGRKPLSEGSCHDGSGMNAKCAGCEKHETGGRELPCARGDTIKGAD